MKNIMEFKYIFLWLSIFIIGSLIVNFLIYPHSFQSFKSNVNNLLSTNIINQKLKQETSTTSTNSCLNELKEKLKITKAKSPFDLTTKIEEYQKFSDTPSALKYLNDWGYGSEEWHLPILFPEFFTGVTYPYEQKELNDIEVILVQFKFNSGYESFKTLNPIICINGELTENSKKKLI